ncbi:protein kinase [Nocardiopsis sp. NPDC050513]|uniref:serine/threonine-protein kinase n=1 Tax=Nocardiopsis sp. NPDC050513 TaxID=3364338 RepID=UPI0037954C29
MSPPPPGPHPSGVAPLTEGDPDRIGPYRLVGRLGAGGMGTVYAGLTPAGERVAVKTVHRQYATDPEFRSRFAREVDLLGRVRSTCAVGVLDADTTGPRPWLASEYVPGPTLRQYVRDHGALTGAALVGVAAGIAEALRAIHAAGVVHRDLTPGNVILSPAGPRILDFGIARAVEETAITRTGGVVGTPGWLAPEQYDGAPPAPAADMFAFGAIVAYASSGREPFGAGPLDMLVYRTRREEPDLAGVPPEFLPLARAALHKDPAARPTAAAALHGALAAWPERAPSTDDTLELTRLLHTGWALPETAPVAAQAWTPPPAQRRRRTRTPLVVSAAVLALVLVAGTLTAAAPPLREATWGRLPFGGPRVAAGDTAGAGSDGADAREPVPCDPDDRTRTAAHEAAAPWRPFDPDALPTETYASLLTPVPEGELVTDPEVWPGIGLLDHDTADLVVAVPGLEGGFPLLTVCWMDVASTPEGAEFTARFTYHPTLGSHAVYAEDFLVLYAQDMATTGTDKGIHRGGTGVDWGGPLTEVAVLDPAAPVQEVTVLVPGSPGRGGIGYRPSAYNGALVHDLTGHCYDVDGTAGWRDDAHEGSEGFALADYRPEQSMLTDCPT